MTHTPGPWAIKNWHGDEATIVGANGSHVTLTMMKHDARYVARVPEMVDLLRKVSEQETDEGAAATALLARMES